MKRVKGIVVCMFFVISSITVLGIVEEKQYQEDGAYPYSSLLLDVLDQKQLDFNPSDDLPIPVGRFDFYGFEIMTAQSFIPTKNMLTRVELYVGKNDSTMHPFVLSIKKDLAGPDLVQKNINPSIFISGDYSWVEFDFDDTWVEVGETYYIVCKSINVTGNWYLWAAHNDSASYPNGCAWVSTDGGNTWSNHSKSRDMQNVDVIKTDIQVYDLIFSGFTWDTCFKTYGRDNLPPGSPSINGPTSGKAKTEYDFTIITVDPEMDDVYYLIDWGDGSIDEWIGPYESDELVIVQHTWNEKGEYTVRTRAKDSHGTIGDWATLEISMPREKMVKTLPLGIIVTFGFDVDVKIVQLPPGEDYVDLEVLSKPFYIWENDVSTINHGAFLRLYEAKGFFSPTNKICFGTCTDWGIIG